MLDAVADKILEKTKKKIADALLEAIFKSEGNGDPETVSYVAHHGEWDLRSFPKEGYKIFYWDGKPILKIHDYELDKNIFSVQLDEQEEVPQITYN